MHIVLSEKKSSNTISKCAFSTLAVPTDVLWIGLNDRRNQMLFEWSDNSHVTLTQWDVDEPSHATNLQEDCVHIRGKVKVQSGGVAQVRGVGGEALTLPASCRTPCGPTTPVRSPTATSARRRPPPGPVVAPMT